MSCWNSKFVEREEIVARCRARKRYMRQVVEARSAFSAAHTMYLRSLRSTGAALLHFATAESNLHLPPSPGSPPHMSPTSWTTISTATSSAVQPSPQPPLPSSSTWDFWDPFVPTSGRSVDEEEWEETTTDTDVAPTATTTSMQSVADPPFVVTTTATATATTTTTSGELAEVVYAKSKDLVEIIQELDDYFSKAANAGGQLSLLLEAPSSNFNQQTTSGKDYGHGRSFCGLMWSWGSGSAKWDAFGKLCEDPIGNNLASMGSNGNGSHCSTVERLHAWEKKLYQEVKNAESLKLDHEKKTTTVRKLEMRNADYFKIEKAKQEADKLETRLLVASEAIETTSAEIIKLRESELYPQLVELVKGLMNMWRSMYESHQVQTHIVQQLKYLNFTASTEPTSEIHRQSTLQLEVEAQQWHISFSNLIKAQRDYIQSLTAWLRLSLFQVGNNPLYKTRQDSPVYSICEEWQLAIGNAPDKVASEGIKSFLTMIHAIVVQQAREEKQKKRSELAFKDLEKKAVQLRSLGNKYGHYLDGDLSGKKRAKVEALRAKAEDEKAKYEKSVSVTRAMSMNNLQMGLPHVFQATTGFANVCAQAFESVHNQVKRRDGVHTMKMILP